MKILDEDLENIIEEIKPEIKKRGYRKHGLNWVKEIGEVYCVFHIQRSQWSTDVWYYGFGIVIKDLYDGQVKSAGECQIKDRLDHIYEERKLTPDILIALIDTWEANFGSVKLLKDKAIESKIPLMSNLIALKWLDDQLGIKFSNDDKRRIFYTSKADWCIYTKY